MRIEIRTIPGKMSAQGIHNWTNNRQQDGKKLGKTKNGNAGFIYGPIPNVKTGRLTTGLDKLIDNPYSKEEIDALGDEWKYLKDKKQITIQEMLEVKHKRSKGFYTSEVWIKEKHGYDEGLTFMQKFKYNLNDGTTLLDTSNVLEELAYYMFADNYKYVAPSYKAYTHGLPDENGKVGAIRFPNATHYISYEDEDEQILHANKAKRNKAFAALEMEELTSEVKWQIARALGWHKEATTDAKLYNVLSQRIESAELKTANNDVDRFMSKVDMIKDAGGRKRLKAESDLQEFVDNRIINVYKGTYTWNAKSMVIGQRHSEAVEFMLDESKSPEVKEMKKELKARLLV